MSETFPGIQQDCDNVISKCQKLHFAASLCCMHTTLGNTKIVLSMIAVMAGLGAEIAETCETLKDTTDHIEPAS